MLVHLKFQVTQKKVKFILEYFCFPFLGIELTDQLTVKHARELKKCTTTIQDFILIRLNEKIANKLLDSINVLHDNYVGTLTRCLFSLENNRDDDECDLSASKALQEVEYS
jgi:hypothetical protein